MLALLLAPLLHVEGRTLKSKGSKEKEIAHIVRNPSETSVIRGERVMLNCEAAPSSAVKSCSWSKSGRELVMDSRHWLEGCSLVINPVQGSDEGSYVCSVKTSNSQLESRAASLEVLVEPGVPSILEAREGDWVEVNQGEELLLTCESQGGRPHAELQWRDAEGQRVFGHVQEHVTRIGSSFKTVSTLRFNPLQPMAVTCTAHSEAFTKVASSRPLTVQLRRKVEEEEVKLREGGSVRLELAENRGPYKWLLNDREIQDETGNSLVIEDFTPDYHNSVVKCIQEKFGGEARVLKIVRLLHDTSPEDRKPRSRDYPVQDDQPVLHGSKSGKAIFTCIAQDDEEAGGVPEYVWVGGTLQTRTRTGKDRHGNGYRCTVMTGGLKKMKQMEKKMKVMAKDLRRFSKTLRNFNS